MRSDSESATTTAATTSAGDGDEPQSCAMSPVSPRHPDDVASAPPHPTTPATPIARPPSAASGDASRAGVEEAGQHAFSTPKEKRQKQLPADHFERVAMWHTVELRKISGNAAPSKKNLKNWLRKNPACEIYAGQDLGQKRALRERRRERAREVQAKENLQTIAQALCTGGERARGGARMQLPSAAAAHEHRHFPFMRSRSPSPERTRCDGAWGSCDSPSSAYEPVAVASTACGEDGLLVDICFEPTHADSGRDAGSASLIAPFSPSHFFADDEIEQLAGLGPLPSPAAAAAQIDGACDARELGVDSGDEWWETCAAKPMALDSPCGVTEMDEHVLFGSALA